MCDAKMPGEESLALCGDRTLCTKTTLLATAHDVKQRLIPINWKLNIRSLSLVSFERVWDLRTEDRQVRHRVG